MDVDFLALRQDVYEMAICLKNSFFLLLILSLISTSVDSAIVNQEKLDSHLRWNLLVPKDQFLIQKEGQKVKIQTNDIKKFEEILKDIQALELDTNYVTKIIPFPEQSLIEIDLKNSSVELFSFYRDTDNKYILDFWTNPDSSIETEKKVVKILPLPKPSPVLVQELKKAPVEKDESLIKAPEEKIDFTSLGAVDSSGGSLSKVNTPQFRDFRYGASFIWDYEPLIPSIEKDISLSSKIPDYLYPIKDRENIDDPKEAHMQLSINFYRGEKWGLLNKSITLYESKYGRDSNVVMNEFLKANSLLRTNLAKPNRGITQSAINLLSNVKDLTDDYDLKSSIFRYLLQYNLDQKDFVKSLELSKQLFVIARAEFDQTLVIQTALTMLHCLSELKQIDQIQDVLNDKKLSSILPPQMGFAYKSYAMLSKGNTKDLIKEYQTLEKSLVRPIHPVILFNTAEAFFRESQYEEALKNFDEFSNTYSYLLKAPHARLRVGLIYELLDKDYDQNKLLYKNAIDRSTSPEIRYEAKIRYVALRNLRNKNFSKEDSETEVFLEQSPDETKVMNKNLKKLLWLLRLRLFIVKKDFEKALAYLTSIPLDSVSPSERRVFEGDGAEIVFGLIQNSYLNEDYARVVKMWEIYKEKYETKVAKNPYMNYVVTDSFLKLGFYKSFERAFSDLLSAQKVEKRSYPVWVERLRKENLLELTLELEMSKLVANKDWDKLRDKISQTPVSLRNSVAFSYHNGILLFQDKKYSESSKEFEKIFIEKNLKNLLSPRQMADLLMTYVESLYQQNNQEKFKSIVEALSGDIEKSKSAQILNVSERINYLLIETYSGEAREWEKLENLTISFTEKFQKSPYSMRVKYLYGLSLIKNSKFKEGKEVLQKLARDKEAPSHIKEMCRSELTSLELKEKNI